MKNYISKGFKDRIEISLANISRSKDDKFALVGAQYRTAGFKCELCGHEPCVVGFNVKNLDSNVVIAVGSECVKHFKFNELDIDLASGLRKRIKSISRKMRRYMKKGLGEDEYKDTDKIQKRESICKLFMKFQTKELLKDNYEKKTTLTKEEILSALS